MDLKPEIDDAIKQYFDNLANVKSLTKKEEHDLLYDYKVNGNIEARNKLIQANLRYANKIAGSFRGYGVDYAELISEANDGLMEAIERFDMSQDVKLFSYAKWYMMQHCETAIRHNARMPKAELPADHSPHSLAEVSFQDASIDENDDTFIYHEYDAEKEKETENLLNTLLSKLTDREREIICLYYGVGYGKKIKLQQIGDRYGITKERVRQIIENAFKKIRSEAILVESPYLSR